MEVDRSWARRAAQRFVEKSGVRLRDSNSAGIRGRRHRGEGPGITKSRCGSGRNDGPELAQVKGLMANRTVRLCGQDIENPGHICAFFNSREEEYSTLLPFLKQGIEEGEEVVNVLDRSRLDDHRFRLEEAGIAGGDRLSLAASEECYLDHGQFDIARMVTFLRDHLENAARANRKVRTAGWMDWLDKDVPGSERAAEYEARMNYLVPAFDCTFMCIYDLSALSGAMVADVMATHPWVILDGEIRKNAFYVPPDEYLKELQAQRDASPAS